MTCLSVPTNCSKNSSLLKTALFGETTLTCFPWYKWTLTTHILNLGQCIPHSVHVLDTTTSEHALVSPTQFTSHQRSTGTFTSSQMHATVFIDGRNCYWSNFKFHLTKQYMFQLSNVKIDGYNKSSKFTLDTNCSTLSSPVPLTSSSDSHLDKLIRKHRCFHLGCQRRLQVPFNIWDQVQPPLHSLLAALYKSQGSWTRRTSTNMPK